MSEDSVRGNPKDPLSLNLYSYCYNSPMRYKDPSGNIALPFGTGNGGTAYKSPGGTASQSPIESGKGGTVYFGSPGGGSSVYHNDPSKGSIRPPTPPAPTKPIVAEPPPVVQEPPTKYQPEIIYGYVDTPYGYRYTFTRDQVHELLDLYQFTQKILGLTGIAELVFFRVNQANDELPKIDIIQALKDSGLDGIAFLILLLPIVWDGEVDMISDYFRASDYMGIEYHFDVNSGQGWYSPIGGGRR